MPDYDPESIPILDDVIESPEDPDENITAGTTDPFAGTDEQTLFSGDSVVDFSAEAEEDIDVPAEMQTEETLLDSISLTEDMLVEAIGQDDTEMDSSPADETGPDSFESALIDYDSEKNSDSPADDEIIDMPAVDEAPVEGTPYSISPSTLQSITEDIVDQLMPDIERRLHFLIRQALEEKLPADTDRSKFYPTPPIDHKIED
ncbi:MAG TPA: hypothetical protein ENJ87_02525 [Gammaproteobacteria bacterium]|nr:hypothetical protein [Gammaproteobacteria bacterium]